MVFSKNVSTHGIITFIEIKKKCIIPIVHSITNFFIELTCFWISVI